MKWFSDSDGKHETIEEFTEAFNKVLQKPSEKVLMNREKYIKEFNPYLCSKNSDSNVSGNLDQKLIDFYREKYNKR